MNNKLKLFSIENTLLSEKLTNWDLLFSETTNTIKNYLKEASEWHKLNYLSENEPFEYLPSDCYDEIVFKVLDLWFPFYDNLHRSIQEKIESNIKSILFEFRINGESYLIKKK
jgi:hypothetical protein